MTADSGKSGSAVNSHGDSAISETSGPVISAPFDISELYAYNPEDLMTDISATAYSNLAYVQATHRDIAIDFLEMPGIKKADGKMHIEGTRIYMSHSAAQKLSEAIADILSQVHVDGGMEVYRPDGE